MSQTDLERRCIEAVDRLLTRYAWRLQGRATLTQQVLALVTDGQVPDPHRAAIHSYTHALHRACSATEGRARQELAYAELHHYLLQIARLRYPDVADDATQRALERIFVRFESCRVAGAFLAFALQQLRDAVRALRSGGGLHHSLDAAPAAGAPALVCGQPEPLDRLIADERVAHVVRLAGEFRRAHPRAAQQFAALWLRHMEDLDDAAISRRLGTSVAHVYVLRARAVRRLQAEPRWQALAAEMGLLSR